MNSTSASLLRTLIGSALLQTPRFLGIGNPVLQQLGYVFRRIPCRRRELAAGVQVIEYLLANGYLLRQAAGRVAGRKPVGRIDGFVVDLAKALGAQVHPAIVDGFRAVVPQSLYIDTNRQHLFLWVWHVAQDHAGIIDGKRVPGTEGPGIIFIIHLAPVGAQQVAHVVVGAGAPGEHPEIPGFGYAFHLLYGAGMTDYFHPVVTQRAGYLRRAAVMAGHGAQLADGGIDHGKQVLDVAPDLLAVFGEEVMGAGAEADVRGDMPLVIFEHDITFRPDDEVGVEPAVRKFGQFLTDAAGDDIQPVLPGDFTQLFRFRPGDGYHLVHLVLDTAFALARRPHALHEILGQHHQAHRLLPEIAHTEVDQVADPVQVFSDVLPFLHNRYFRLHHQRRVGRNSFRFFRHGNISLVSDLLGKQVRTEFSGLSSAGTADAKRTGMYSQRVLKTLSGPVRCSACSNNN